MQIRCNTVVPPLLNRSAWNIYYISCESTTFSSFFSFFYASPFRFPFFLLILHLIFIKVNQNKVYLNTFHQSSAS